MCLQLTQHSLPLGCAHQMILLWYLLRPFAAGGEGSTAREVLRHRSVERVVMVDIDKVRAV